MVAIQGSVRRAARNGDRVVPRVWAAGETHRGHVRETNQDVIVVEPDIGLFAVLDGMGGANAGDVAARLGGEQMAACVRRKLRSERHRPRTLLELALHTAAIEVFKAAEQRVEYHGMGTTVVACLILDPARVVVGHAGDSRAYLLRNGELAALTRDHTVAQRLVDAGALRSDEAERSPHRHMLTRNLGRAYSAGPDIVEQTLAPGDRLLLCSDGLYGGVPAHAIRRVLGASAAPAQIAHELVELALRGEASDNISAIVIGVDSDRPRAATPRPSSRTRVRRARAPAPRKRR